MSAVPKRPFHGHKSKAKAAAIDFALQAMRDYVRAARYGVRVAEADLALRRAATRFVEAENAWRPWADKAPALELRTETQT